MKRLAIITMVFNEAFNLPPWLRYYSVQVDELSDLFLLIMVPPIVQQHLLTGG